MDGYVSIMLSFKPVPSYEWEKLISPLSFQVDLSNFFSDWPLSNVEETSLTLMHVLKTVTTPADVHLAPMDIKTFRVRLK